MISTDSRTQTLQSIVVTAEQMRQIEARIFSGGMPVAALMEKVAGLITHWVTAHYPHLNQRVGVLVGPGHNGGDALVVARELYFRGYTVAIYCPFANLKDLTAQHYAYCKSLSIPLVEDVASLRSCTVLVDGLFGFGLERSLTGDIAATIDQLNQWSQPIISIDLPSGLHTDTGAVLGTAIRATHTLCLGLWKQGLLQDQALDHAGKVELIDFDVPLTDVRAVLPHSPAVQRMTPESAIARLPLTRPAATHKYKMGQVLLICGSRQYAGGALLTGLGARASGVGMLSIAVPQSLKAILTAQLPEALITGCPESETGAIAELPPELDLSTYDVIACGPGLTKGARAVVHQVLNQNQAIVLDADGLNILAEHGTLPTLQSRQAPIVITPHMGEFKRLFPDLVATAMNCHVTAVQSAASQSGAIVLLKGARVAIADASGSVWINPDSTAALARGGSGDVLTGLLGGLWAQAIASPEPSPSILDMVAAGVWWHAHAGILAVQERTVLGVDAYTLSQYLIPALHHAQQRQATHP